jgi:hypothetical protein
MGDQISTLSLQELQTVRADLVTKLKRVNERIKVLMEEDARQLSDVICPVPASSTSSTSSASAPSAEKKKKVVKKAAASESATPAAKTAAPAPAPATARASASSENEDTEGLLKKVTMDDMRFILNKNKIEWGSTMKRADLAQLIRTNALVRKALKYHNDRINAKSAAGGASAADSD